MTSQLRYRTCIYVYVGGAYLLGNETLKSENLCKYTLLTLLSKLMLAIAFGTCFSSTMYVYVVKYESPSKEVELNDFLIALTKELCANF